MSFGLLGTGCAEPPTSSSAVTNTPGPAFAAAKAGNAVYQVTIENLTTGQPLTPPVVATHRKPVHLFEVGASASFELKEVAENGNLDPMVTALSGNKHVDQVVVAVAGDPPPVLPGQSVSFEISGERGAKYLSYASMLICTNDGFTGVNGQRLPKQVGDVVVVESAGYDAGTEINTEDFADIVPPCPGLTGVPSSDPGTGTSDPALAEGGIIHHHDGIQGIDDLVVGIHGWANPVPCLRARCWPAPRGFYFVLPAGAALRDSGGKPRVEYAGRRGHRRPGRSLREDRGLG
jgi:hypothetical protein